jgi:leucyl-tRNA---protein transferase
MVNPMRNIRLSTFPSRDCVYLPGRAAQMRGFVTRRLAQRDYRQLMDSGFRRSGLLVYRPACDACRECRSLRVPVERFVFSASQRRCWRRNADLQVTTDNAQPTAEKYDLYARYLRQWHARDEDATPEAFIGFLYESPLQTLEMEYRDGGGRLLAVGICDRVNDALSSVYLYFDPEHAHRRLGTFGALWEIEYARRQKLAYYYLGYWVEGCAAMYYKASFRPHEVLGTDGVWRSGKDAGVPPADG